MSKLKLNLIISVLLALVLLMSSCDIGDVLNPGKDDATEPPSQTTPEGECTHKFGEWEVVLEATCTQKGKQVRVCSLCMHIENSDIEFKSHTPETLSRVDPTCKAEGKTEGEQCAVCKTVLKAQEPISAIPHDYDNGVCTMCGAEEPDCNHTFGEWNTVKDATCADKGLQERSCSACGEKEQGEIAALPHTEVIDKAVAATCTETGLTEGMHCSVCKAVLIAQETVKANGHKYTEGVCHCGAKDPDYVPVKKYTVVFKDYDGTTLSTQSVKEGTAAPAPQNPTRDGYEFTGWDKSFSNVKSNITVTAMYEKISTEPQFKVSSKEAKRGSTVEVTVALKNNPGIASIILSLVYDTDALTLTEVVYNTAIGGQTVQPQNMNSPVKLYWINGFANAEGDFILATLKFTVKSDASAGDHYITLSYNADDVYDISENNIKFEIVNGKITVTAKETECKHQYGEWTTVQNSTCTSEGLKERSCNLCGEKEQEGIAIRPHTVVIDKEVDPTCTETGLTEGKHCAVCKEVIIKQEIISMLNHQFYQSVCRLCGTYEEGIELVDGLLFKISNDRKSYTLVGIMIMAEEISIPSYVNNLPVTEIGEKGALGNEYATCLITVRFPDTIEKISENAFKFFSYLENVILSESITSIGEDAFFGCAIKSIRIPASVTEIGPGAFSDCDDLESITVAKENTVYYSVGNCIIERATKSVVSGCKNSTIPSDGSVTSIGEDAFNYISNFTSIKIPEGIVSIEDNAFSCGDLQQVTLPSTLKTIGKMAFYGNDDLTEIVLPYGVTTIGKSAFHACDNFQKITIPNTVTYIGEKIFNIFNPLVPGSVVTVTFIGTETEWNNISKEKNWSGNIETIKMIFAPSESLPKSSFIVSKATANSGEKIEITVALKSNPGIASIILSVVFDSDALTLTDVVYNNAIGGQTVQPQNMNSPVKLYWINGFANAEGDFVLATLKFTVKSDAAVGDYDIALSYNADDVYDISETNLPFEIVNGKITVKQ